MERAPDRVQQQRDLVVVAASAGGVEALRKVVAGLPPEFPAPVLIVLHVAASSTSVLPQILGRAGSLPASFPVDRQELRRGEIYVAPPDRHLIVEDGVVRVTHGPRENGHRPAADPLFRSAARSGRGRVIGVVLSGLLDDGAAGLRFVKEHGGAAVVQSPDDAMFPSMPAAAIAATEIDRVADADHIAEVLCELVDQPLPAEAARPPARQDDAASDDLEPAMTEAIVGSAPTMLTCPECGGSLWENENGGLVRYACHVGHGYSLQSLVEEQGRALETTLWSALRALEERADLQRRLARRAGTSSRRRRHEATAKTAEREATSIRAMLDAIGRVTVADGAEEER